MNESKLSWDDAVTQWQSEFEGRLTSAVKELLERKHLYQSTNVDMVDRLEKLRARLFAREHNEYQFLKALRPSGQ